MSFLFFLKDHIYLKISFLLVKKAEKVNISEEQLLWTRLIRFSLASNDLPLSTIYFTGFFRKEILLEFQPKKKNLYVAIHSYFGFFPTPQINEWLNWLRRLPPSSFHCIFLQKQHLSPRGYLLILMLLFSHSVMFFCDPMDCSIPGFTVLHYLPQFT